MRVLEVGLDTRDAPGHLDVLAAEAEHIGRRRVPDESAGVGHARDRAAVVVSPLRVGGGIKVKVLKALCRGKAIVTTSIGAQGLGAELRARMIVADEPNAFARAAAELLVDAD